MTKKEYKEILDCVIDRFIIIVDGPSNIYISGDSSYLWTYTKPLRLPKKENDTYMKMNEYIIKRKKDLP